MRKRGLTLGEIMDTIKLPKTTIYDNIRDIPLPLKTREKIRRESTVRLVKFSKEKAKCLPKELRNKIQPLDKWSKDFIFLVSHFMFDGDIQKGNCSYNNRNIALINAVERSLSDLFKFKPYYRIYEDTGVHRISYYRIEIAHYFKDHIAELKRSIKKSSLMNKRIFLRAFFDDEGCAYLWKNARKVRGYQHNLKILKLVQQLLKDFNIESKIDEKYQEIIISRKENLIKFRDKINFSKGVYINPDRKNSVWKRKLEKRKILDIAIDSYIN